MQTATAPDHRHHDHHDMPTSGSALTRVALSATLHCLTGCAIGEVLGIVIGTALGFSALGTVALAVALAFLFGYGLTSLPLLRAGLAFSTVVPIALASDTLSIATMEIVDNAIILAVPGAMEEGLGSLLFWGSLAFALVVAGAVALPVNRWLIARGKGHAVVHETGIHGGLSPRVVGVAAAVAFVFGASVLVAELVDGSSGDGATMGAAGHEQAASAAAVRGLSASSDGLSLELDTSALARDVATVLRFRVRDDAGAVLRDFEVEQDKRMHLILVRRDLTGFQHLHPTMAQDGTWSTRLTVAAGGSYRVFADFKHDGRSQTLARNVAVAGPFEPVALPAATTSTTTEGGYSVRIDTGAATAGRETALAFDVTRGGRPVTLQPPPRCAWAPRRVARDGSGVPARPPDRGRDERRPRALCDRVSDERSLPPVRAVQARRARAHRAIHRERRQLITRRPGRLVSIVASVAT